jgi:hypothetical protein
MTIHRLAGLSIRRHVADLEDNVAGIVRASEGEANFGQHTCDTDGHRLREHLRYRTAERERDAGADGRRGCLIDHLVDSACTETGTDGEQHDDNGEDAAHVISF